MRSVWDTVCFGAALSSNSPLNFSSCSPLRYYKTLRRQVHRYYNNLKDTDSCYVRHLSSFSFSSLAWRVRSVCTCISRSPRSLHTVLSYHHRHPPLFVARSSRTLIHPKLRRWPKKKNLGEREKRARTFAMRSGNNAMALGKKGPRGLTTATGPRLLL